MRLHETRFIDQFFKINTRKNIMTSLLSILANSIFQDSTIWIFFLISTHLSEKAKTNLLIIANEIIFRFNKNILIIVFNKNWIKAKKTNDNVLNQ
jgi:hypothetical protein